MSYDYFVCKKAYRRTSKHKQKGISLAKWLVKGAGNQSITFLCHHAKAKAFSCKAKKILIKENIHNQTQMATIMKYI